MDTSQETTADRADLDSAWTCLAGPLGAKEKYKNKKKTVKIF